MVPSFKLSALFGVVIVGMSVSSKSSQLLVESDDKLNTNMHRDVVTSSKGMVALPRKKRNVAQLGYLVDTYTPYSSTQLLKHGNWCGYGGDRFHDGSIRSQCDKCCKVHDSCYSELLDRTTENLGINEIISNLQVFGPYIDGKLLVNIGLPQKTRRCIPYVDIYKVQASGSTPQCVNVGGVCSRRACQCDMQFVNCLRNSQCQLHR